MTEILAAVERKRERFLEHCANCSYVAIFHQQLRKVRGERPQMQIAAMADVDQSYVSRVEAGSTQGIGYAALCRILAVYKELQDAGRH